MDGPNDETLLRTQLLGSSGSSVLSPAALNAFLTRHPDFLNSPAYRQLSTLIQSSTITEHAVPALGATATSSAAEPIRRSSLQKTAGMATASRPPVAIDLPISSGAPTMILSDEGDRTAYLQDNVQQPRMTVLPHSAPHSGVLLNSSASLAPQSYHEQLNKQHLMLPPQNLQRALSSQYLQLHQQQQPQPQALTVPMSQMQFVSLGQNQQQTNIQAQLVSVSRPPPLSTVQLPQTQPSTSSQALQLRASSEINTTIQLQLIQSLLQPLEERINQIEKNNQAYYRFTDQLSTRIKQTNSILSELRPSIRQLAGGIGSHPFFDPPFETLAVETREVQVGNLPIVLPQLVTDVCVIDPVSNLSSSVSLKFWYFVTGHLDKQICSRFVSTPNKSLNVGNIQMDLEGQSCLEGCPHQSIRPIYAFFGDEQYDYPRQNIQFLFEYRGVNVGRLAYFVEGRGFLVHPALVWLYSKDIGGPIGQSLLDAVLESCTDHKDTLLRVMEDAGFPYWQDHGDSDSPEKAGLNISDSQEINPGGWEKGSSSNSTSKFFVNNDLQSENATKIFQQLDEHMAQITQTAGAMDRIKNNVEDAIADIRSHLDELSERILLEQKMRADVEQRWEQKLISLNSEILSQVSDKLTVSISQIREENQLFRKEITQSSARFQANLFNSSNVNNSQSSDTQKIAANGMGRGSWNGHASSSRTTTQSPMPDNNKPEVTTTGSPAKEFTTHASTKTSKLAEQSQAKPEVTSSNVTTSSANVALPQQNIKSAINQGQMNNSSTQLCQSLPSKPPSNNQQTQSFKQRQVRNSEEQGSYNAPIMRMPPNSLPSRPLPPVQSNRNRIPIPGGLGYSSSLPHQQMATPVTTAVIGNIGNEGYNHADISSQLTSNQAQHSKRSREDEDRRRGNYPRPRH